MTTVQASTVTPTTAGAIACTIGMSIVGASVALAPMLADYPVLAGQAWRYLVAGLVLVPLLARSSHPMPRLPIADIARLVLIAATGLAGFNWCLIEGARRADPALLGAVIGSVPLILAITGARSAGRRVQPRAVVAGAVVATGIVFVHGATGAPAAAIPYAIGLVICEVAFTLLAVPLLRRISPLQLTAAVCMLAVPLLAALAALDPGADLQAPTATELLALGYMALFTTAVAFLLWYRGVAVLGADRAGLFCGVMPVAGVVTGLALGTTTPSLLTLAGVTLCATGIAFGLQG